MAEHQDEVVTAFQDDFTQRVSTAITAPELLQALTGVRLQHGATFMILVEPIFADQARSCSARLSALPGLTLKTDRSLRPRLS